MPLEDSDRAPAALILSLGAALFIVVGITIYDWAAPSPHGIIEGSFGLPMFLLGWCLLGVSGFLRFTRLSLWVSVVLAIVLALPLTYFAWLLLLSSGLDLL